MVYLLKKVDLSMAMLVITINSMVIFHGKLLVITRW